jgi:hypothetical protein
VAFVACLCHADQQSERGRFRNERLLKVLLEKRARWVPFLIAHGDLVVLPDGRLYVDGWDEWQEGDLTVPERMVRLRARKNVTNGVTPVVTADVTGGVTVPSSVSGSDVAVNKSGGGAPSRAPSGGKAQPTTDESPTSGLWGGRGLHKGQHIGCLVCEAVPSSAAEAAKAKLEMTP